MKPSQSFLSEIISDDQYNCSICPRDCNVDRSSTTSGYCNSSKGFDIASICIHKGEEPVIGGDVGICNVFFSGCNLQCIFCQNKQISSNSDGTFRSSITLEEVIEKICNCLDQGCHAVGFVSPSHMIPQMLRIINALHKIGRKPVIVYNTNAYDKVEVLKQLEGLIDVYLPDLKYSQSNLATELSDAPDYVDVANRAIREMFRQKGTPLHLDESGRAISGLIIRHLVLPGYIENSKGVLRYISENLSPRIHISLMSQYYPMDSVARHPDLNRVLRKDEYDEIVHEMEYLGMENGWVQELESSRVYLPDFKLKQPFKDENKLNLIPN